ncbi:hypothetical protein [Nostoc sp. CCY0012]|uniref:hypothetical protein n=1 Tax=Nostoc sp. CCY0012 TaxID=1056123 RepID=UPI0039C70C2D
MPKILIIDELGKENFGSDRHRYRQLISTCTMIFVCKRTFGQKKANASTFSLAHNSNSGKSSAGLWFNCKY